MIVGKNKKVVSKDYFIINPVYPIDCLDIKKSGPKYSKIVKTNISEVKHLIIDEKRIPKDSKIFRINHFYTPIIISKDLAKEIDDKKFTGFRWIRLEDYPEKD